MLLAIDTSTRTAGVALWSDGTVVAELTWQAGQNQTAELFPGIETALRLGRTSIDRITGIAVAKGPGSFNGVRVGVSAAKGLAIAQGLPLVGVSTLEAQAYPFAACPEPVLAILPAGRTEFAVAKYRRWRGVWRTLAGEQIADFAAVCQLAGKHAVFVGEITADLAGRLRGVLGLGVHVVSPSGGVRRAAAVAELAWQRLGKGESDDVETLQPIYLRRPPITRRKGELTT